ncbi:MAG: hypothetical protein SFU98_17930 [Leptospiraceae bacterium]|nr:hypothetical protein [Leptospiraceae bacterium]
MKVNYFLLFILFNFINCLTTIYKPDIKFEEKLLSNEVNLMIGYDVYMSQKITSASLDQEIFIPIINTFEQLELIKEHISKKKNFHKVLTNSNELIPDLEAFIRFKYDINITSLFLYAFTLSLFPVITNCDLEIELQFKDSVKKLESKKYIQTSSSNLYFGIVPLFSNLYESAPETRRKVIRTMIDKLMSDLSQDPIFLAKRKK